MPKASSYDCYRKVTSQADIKDGGEYIVVVENVDGKCQAFNGSIRSGSMELLDITEKVSDHCYVGPVNKDDGPSVITLKASGNNFLIKVGAKTISVKSTTSNANIYYNEKETKWVLQYNEDGTVGIQSTHFTTREWRYKSSAIKNYAQSNDLADYPRPTLYLRETPTFTIGSKEGYGTFYTNRAYVMPSGAKGALVTAYQSAIQGKYDLSLDFRYPAGSIVPANTPLLLYGGTGTYEYQYSDSNDPNPADNYLQGTLDGSVSADADCNFYALMYDQQGENIGFYRGQEDGSAFDIKPNQAYLKLPKSMQVEFFRFHDFATGIDDVPVVPGSADNSVYTLQGIKCSCPFSLLPSGVYIVNGCKVVK